MNRPGGVPQSLRGIPSGFGAQQQPPQQTRSVSSRLPNGKLGSNASGWAFGSGVPLSGGSGAGGSAAAGLQNPSRQQQMGSNISFAQSLGGSQPATPLDLSEFPSLSNSSQLSSAGQPSLWSTTGPRNIGSQAIQRSANTPLSSQQNQQDDMFGSTSRAATNQGSFRFGNQANLGQTAPPSSQPGSIDDFPPLNRSGNAGDIGQDRASGLMSSLSYGSQTSATSPAPQNGRLGNGLLNALSANTRSVGEAPTPVSTRPQESRSLVAEEDSRPKQDGEPVQSPIGDDGGPPQSGGESRNSVSAIGVDGPPSAKLRDESEAAASSVQDPLAGMSQLDRWGVKGMRTLMNNPDYSTLVSGFGLDLNSLGVDLGSNELLSTQSYSLFSGAAPQPTIPKFRLPDCYKVSNVGPIENKISSFNEETLMWIFYSCPNDYKQHLAAVELSNRNWRWHKRQQVWLTKDDLMMPQVLSMNHERGYYIVWDTSSWRKERTPREITLNYADLDNTPIGAGGAV